MNPFHAFGLMPVAAAILLVGGCTVTRTEEAPGVMRFSIDNTLPNNAAPPPAGLVGNAEAMSPPPAPRSGHYAGYGYNILDPGGMCAGEIRIYNFIVSGNQASFGAYHGTIQPDGHLSMEGRPTRIYGQFVGTHFEGHYWQPGPSCTYSMSLEGVA